MLAAIHPGLMDLEILIQDAYKMHPQCKDPSLQLRPSACIDAPTHRLQLRVAAAGQHDQSKRPGLQFVLLVSSNENGTATASTSKMLMLTPWTRGCRHMPSE